MVFIVIFTATAVLQLFLPWWIIVPISFVTCGIIGKTGKISLWAPFFAILLLWTGVALLKSIPNQNVLASRIAEMLGVKIWELVLVLSALLGAFVAAISGYCGYHFRKAVLINRSTTA